MSVQNYLEQTITYPLNNVPFNQHSHPDDAPTEYWITGIKHTTIGYTSGLSAHQRPELPGYNSGVLCLVLAMLLAIVFNVRHYGRFFKTLIQNLWSVRVRTNLFDEHTVNETRIIVTLVCQTCICEALLIVAWMIHSGCTFTSGELTATVAATCLMTGAYYVMQLAAYRTVAYAFTSRNLAHQWMRGFNATQTLLGFGLLVPTLVLLFYPAATAPLLILAIFLYIIARIVFICKGFRIFYHNLFSLIYFILYLCSLEIIPLLIVYQAVVSISRNFLS